MVRAIATKGASTDRLSRPVLIIITLLALALASYLLLINIPERAVVARVNHSPLPWEPPPASHILAWTDVDFIAGTPQTAEKRPDITLALSELEELKIIFDAKGLPKLKTVLATIEFRPVVEPGQPRPKTAKRQLAGKADEAGVVRLTANMASPRVSGKYMLRLIINNKPITEQAAHITVRSIQRDSIVKADDL